MPGSAPIQALEDAIDRTRVHGGRVGGVEHQYASENARKIVVDFLPAFALVGALEETETRSVNRSWLLRIKGHSGDEGAGQRNGPPGLAGISAFPEPGAGEARRGKEHR